MTMKKRSLKKTRKPAGKRIPAGRTRLGLEVEEALKEVYASKRGGAALRTVAVVQDWPKVADIRKQFGLSRQKFADRFGLDFRAVQDWEQGRRHPDRAARVLLTVIDRQPEAVDLALHGI